jgi:hypothetical protein
VALGGESGVRSTDTAVGFGSASTDPWESAFTQLDAGANSLCGVRDDGTLCCWADVIDAYDEDPDPVPEGTFRRVASGFDYAGGDLTRGLALDGAASGWGVRGPGGSVFALEAGGTAVCALRDRPSTPGPESERRWRRSRGSAA